MWLKHHLSRHSATFIVREAEADPETALFRKSLFLYNFSKSWRCELFCNILSFFFGGFTPFFMLTWTIHIIMGWCKCTYTHILFNTLVEQHIEGFSWYKSKTISCTKMFFFLIPPLLLSFSFLISVPTNGGSLMNVNDCTSLLHAIRTNSTFFCLFGIKYPQVRHLSLYLGTLPQPDAKPWKPPHYVTFFLLLSFYLLSLCFILLFFFSLYSLNI